LTEQKRKRKKETERNECPFFSCSYSDIIVTLKGCCQKSIIQTGEEKKKEMLPYNKNNILLAPRL